MVRIVEVPVMILQSNNINYNLIQNCIWNNVVFKMTTVGYGDVFPQTNLGRFILIIAVFTGITIISFSVVTLQNYLKFNDSELKVSES